MTYDDLVATLGETAPPAAATGAQRALWLTKKGDWDAAHRVATDIETPLGSRIHALLHRIEGDLSNARYWYRRAGKEPFEGSVDEEWEHLAREASDGKQSL